jgi:hypothetical protein
MKVESNLNTEEELQIVITLSKEDQLCLKHDLIDIVEWYSKGPSSEKICNCRKRMIKDYKETLMKSPELQKMTLEDVNSLLGNEMMICEKISKLPEYKNRVQREVSVSSLV